MVYKDGVHDPSIWLSSPHWGGGGGGGGGGRKRKMIEFEDSRRG